MEGIAVQVRFADTPDDKPLGTVRFPAVPRVGEHISLEAYGVIGDHKVVRVLWFPSSAYAAARCIEIYIEPL